MIDDKLLARMSDGYDLDAISLRKNLKFNGKSLEDWSISLSIEFKNDPDFVDIQNFAQDLDSCFSIAHNNLIVSSGVLNFRRRTLEHERLNAFNDIEEQNIKRTVGDKERIIDNKVRDSTDKVIVAEFINEFWKEQVKLLEKRQETLKTLYWNLKEQGSKV